MKKSQSLIPDHREEITTHECKNCSTPVEGDFCHFCGQRYHDHKESFGELAYEFMSDFLHFDSRFFRTVLPLIFQPGKLTKNYNEGKQRSQFHPIRLYLFSSFVYFFLFFYFNDVEEKFEAANKDNQAAFIIDSARNAIQKDSLNMALKETSYTALRNEILTGNPVTSSKPGNKEVVTPIDTSSQFSFSATPYIDSLLQKKVTPDEYLLQQNSLSRNKRDGFFTRIITVRLLKINLEGEAGKKEFFKKLIETFFHNIPKMLFILLPIFALLLKLLYIRRKQFYYVDHAILSLHYFSLIFLLLIFSKYILDKIFSTDFFSTVAIFWIIVYLFIAMKRLYLQSWVKTFVKYCILGILFFFTVIFTLLLNLAWSALMM